MPTIATQGQGVKELTAYLEEATPPQFHLSYPPEIEKALDRIDPYLVETPIASRVLGILWLCGDETATNWLEKHLDKTTLNKLERLRVHLQRLLSVPLSSTIQKTRLQYVDQLAAQVVVESGQRASGIAAQMGRLAIHPIWGLPILGMVLLALYWFVGFLGAQVLVDLLEISLFQEIINPWVTSQINILISNKFFADLIIGEYGLGTMGLTYALVLILPIVTTFFLAFGVMEDSGYLPRVAVLTNRIFMALGLNGKAVLPMILGLGCVTMATLTTRVMDNKRERLLVTLLLALAVPCSAQLGVVMGMLAGVSFTATLIWGGVVLLVFLIVGWLAARLSSGERTPLLVELPPLRWPEFSNVITKTAARLEWYLKEVVPLFFTWYCCNVHRGQDRCT